MSRLLGLIIAGLVIGLAACSGGATSAPQNVQQITLEVSEFKYTPSTLQVQKGQPVKLTIQNKGAVDHDWTIQKVAVTGVKTSGGSSHSMDMSGMNPDLHLAVGVGKTEVIEFTPTQAGTFDFACTVSGHKEAGLAGSLVVK